MYKPMRAIAFTLVLLCIILSVHSAGAIYSFDGVPYPDRLDLIAHGTFRGGVYIGEARGLGFPPYEQTFELPEKITVRWARLYVGVWGGTERYEGWVRTTFNGHDLGKTPLHGVDDTNPHVYCSGHGVYWTFYDVSDKVLPGLNTGRADTSRGERGNKLDGRVYGIILVAIYESPGAPEITYWVGDGNPNLHGKGWAGTIPTQNDVASVQFIGAINPQNLESARLAVAYLAGNLGEPDYLEFNGQLIGGSDVANNADGETYGIDLKTFEVTPSIRVDSIRAVNNLRFLRGMDVNADGVIDVDDGGNLEGEYYLHPVLAVLVLEHRGTEKTGPDFTVELLHTNLTAGENLLTALVTNNGRVFADDVALRVTADDSILYSDVIRMDASGIRRIAIPWTATSGTYMLIAEVDPENAVQELNEKNNAFNAEVYVMRNADLSVRILTPVARDTRRGAMTSAGGGMLGILLVLMMGPGRCKKMRLSSTLLMGLGVLGFALIITGCIEERVGEEQPRAPPLSYSVPVEVTNEGEAAAQDFELALYIDGEKSVTKGIEMLEGGASVHEEIQITVSEGKHTLRAVVDEQKVVRESRRDNNEAEVTFEF